jgi:2-dehydro-3-deoxyglucarate aldolase
MGRTKSKLRDGLTVRGGWVMIGHPTVVEIMAGVGFDFIGVDMEHTSIDMRQFHELALAAKGTDCDLLVRLPSCDADLAKKALDLGAAGVIVPSVNTPELARDAVAMTKFPPEGVRGASLCRASDFGRRFRTYFDAHNGGVLVVVMLEHVDAVRNADAILTTPGVDAALIGPYDLSTSMGRSGQLDDPDVRRAQGTILDACRRHGVPAGIHVVPPDPDEIQQRQEQGFRFLVCSIDTQLLLAGCQAMLANEADRA